MRMLSLPSWLKGAGDYPDDHPLLISLELGSGALTVYGDEDIWGANLDPGGALGPPRPTGNAKRQKRLCFSPSLQPLPAVTLLWKKTRLRS